jgi:peptide-methionine (S)-S-oxide reductase
MTSVDKITLGGGCFWCLEAVYSKLNGVSLVRSGYSGGMIENPSYELICSGTTQHVEVCEVLFDSSVLSLETLLDIFWEVHDPTTVNRQGYDVGAHYRSVIYCENENQIVVAQKSKDRATAQFTRPIVTEISMRTNFYFAGNQHASFFDLNKNQPYCQIVISPKIKKLTANFSAHLKKE